MARVLTQKMSSNQIKRKRRMDRARAKQIRAEINRLQAEMNRMFSVPDIDRLTEGCDKTIAKDF
jgi:hypothetical protein